MTAPPCDTYFDRAIEALWAPAAWREACPVTAAHVTQQATKQTGPLREAFEKYDTVLLPWVGARFREAPVRVGVYLREYPFPTPRSEADLVLDGDRGGHVPADVMRQAFWHNRESRYSAFYQNTVEETLVHLPRILKSMSTYAAMRGHAAGPFPARPALLDHIVTGDWVKLFAPFYAPDRPGRSSWHHREVYTFAGRRLAGELDLLGLDWVVVLGRSGADRHLAPHLRRWLAGGKDRQAVLLPHPAQNHLATAMKSLGVNDEGLFYTRRASLQPKEDTSETLDLAEGQGELLEELQTRLERVRGMEAEPTDRAASNFRSLWWPDDAGCDFLQLQRRRVVVKLLASTYPDAQARFEGAGWEIKMQGKRQVCVPVPNDATEPLLDRFEFLLRGP